jgi:tRNA threonylcarbamoyladenosine biosynthesis protein TsaE
LTERLIILTSLAETDRFGRTLGAHLPSRTVCLLRGDLAAGKTTLIKSICAAFGIDPKTVISPTYTLVNWYEGEAGAASSICHVDFYRLERTAELYDMDQDDWLNPDGPTFIEWPDVALPLLAELGAPVLEIALAQPEDAGDNQDFAGETVRYATLTSNDAAYEALFNALAETFPAEAPC